MRQLKSSKDSGTPYVCALTRVIPNVRSPHPAADEARAAEARALHASPCPSSSGPSRLCDRQITAKDSIRSVGPSSGPPSLSSRIPASGPTQHGSRTARHLGPRPALPRSVCSWAYEPTKGGNDGEPPLPPRDSCLRRGPVR